MMMKLRMITTRYAGTTMGENGPGARRGRRCFKLPAFCLLFLGSSFVSTIGCSSSSNDNTSPPIADAGANEPSPPIDPDATGTLSVIVEAPIAPNLIPTKNAPVPNAVVALDKPGGEHEELTTGADGRVTFKGINWSKGTASLITYAEGFGLYGVADVSPSNFQSITFSPAADGAPVDIILFPFPKSKTTSKVDVSLKSVEPDGYVTISSTSVEGSAVEGMQSQFSLFVQPTTQAFSILAQEMTLPPDTFKQMPFREFDGTQVRWAKFDLPSIPTSPVTLDLALAGETLTPITTSFHLSIPGGPQGVFGATSRAFHRLTTAETASGVALGRILKQKLSADKATFDLVQTRVDLPAAGATLINSIGVFTDDGFASGRMLLGAPTEGMTIDGLPLPMPPGPSVQSLKDPVPLVGANPLSVTRFTMRDVNDQIIFVVDAPQGATAMHLPKIPQVGQPLFATAVQKGTLESLSEINVTLGLYMRFAVTKPFAVTP